MHSAPLSPFLFLAKVDFMQAAPSQRSSLSQRDTASTARVVADTRAPTSPGTARQPAKASSGFRSQV